MSGRDQTPHAGLAAPARVEIRGEDGKGARTRQAILDAAIIRFARDGFRATSMADIARDAGLSSTGAYPYFANKEALFFDAVDADSAALIAAATDVLTGLGERPDWRVAVAFGLISEVEKHPLARRLLAGLEPEVTERVLNIPALELLRTQLSERIALEQRAGRIRDDIDAGLVCGGAVVILLSLLMSVVQIGPAAIGMFQHEVEAFFDAAFAPIRDPGKAAAPLSNL